MFCTLSYPLAPLPRFHNKHINSLVSACAGVLDIPLLEDRYVQFLSLGNEKKFIPINLLAHFMYSEFRFSSCLDTSSQNLSFSWVCCQVSRESQFCSWPNRFPAECQIEKTAGFPLADLSLHCDKKLSLRIRVMRIFIKKTDTWRH